MIQPITKKIQQIVWYAMIAVLPITSMPIISRLLGADSVASPAIILLICFVLLWIINRIYEPIWVSRNVLILALFCVFAVITTILSVFYDLPLYKNFTSIKPGITALITLAIGFFFFTSASTFPESPQIKNTSLKIINYSGLIILIWCGIQAISWYTRLGYPRWMFNFQGIFSARVLYRQRVTGFALEPSWLAHQLNLFYLPYWLASSLLKFSSHRFKFLGLSFENILLAGGVFSLGLTLSRVGFAAFAMILFIAAIIIHSRIVTLIQIWINKTFKSPRVPSRGLISIIILGFYIVVFVVALTLYSRVDTRMANLFSINMSDDNPLLRYFDDLQFGDRVVYWLTGWNIFNDYPILGVGLGNAGFFFAEKIPPFGWSLFEVRRLMYRSDLLLNIKNLWFRLLAETGIVGFALFSGWLVSLTPVFFTKYQSKSPIEKAFGLMGMMTLAALFFEGFSIDSFAMPYWWISLGMATASYKE